MKRPTGFVGYVDMSCGRSATGKLALKCPFCDDVSDRIFA